MDSHHDLGSGMKRMLHKRQRVVATESETTTAARGRARTSATELAAIETTTTARSQHERPSFLTASTRTTVVTAPVAATTSTSASTAASSTTSTTEDATTSSTTTQAAANTRNRGTTSSASSAAPNVASVGTQSSGFNPATATPINTSPKSDSASSSSHGGAVAGAIIAVVAVLAIGVGFFIWRKRRNNRLARDGLITGGGYAGGPGGGGAGSYKKQDEDHDAWDGNGNAGNGSFGRDDSSLFGGREKTFSQESFNPAPGQGGYGATSSWNQTAPHQQQQPQPQQYYNGGGPGQEPPSWNNGSNVYPPSNQPLPPSTANLLAHQSQSNVLPASLAAGAGAGAAGFGAARLLAAQSQTSSPAASISNGADAHYQSIEQRELQQELDDRRQSFLNKTQSPLPVPAAAPQSPFGESEGQGEIRVVKGTFDPSLDDELVLYPGDKVQVLMKYDDGWALGLNLSSGVPPSKGVFPFDCLGEQVAAPSPSEIRAPNAGPPSAAVQRSLSPINPANVPLPPPTPTLLTPIHEDEQPPHDYSASTSAGPPQLAPFERSDSPLSPDFLPSAVLAVPTSSANSSPTKQPQPAASHSTKLKRHSSLIASRDADLFVALGEVLDKEKH